MSGRVMQASNLFDHFQELVGDATAETGASLSDDTTLYLANLLTERARADRPSPPELTLAELHARAAHAPPPEQARTYRELGDRALYLLGYFAESLSRRLVSPGYYAAMGSAAYHRVDHVFKAWFRDAFGPVFEELSTDFDACVAILTTVRDVHDGDHPDPLVRLYERWAETGDPQLAERLAAKGLILPRAGPVRG